MGLVGLIVGDDGWTSCIDWVELSVAVVSERSIFAPAPSAMESSAMASSASRRKLKSPLLLFVSLSLYFQAVLGKDTVKFKDRGGGDGVKVNYVSE